MKNFFNKILDYLNRLKSKVGLIQLPRPNIQFKFNRKATFAPKNRIDFERLASFLFSSESRPIINSVFIASFAALCAYSAGKIIALSLHNFLPTTSPSQTQRSSMPTTYAMATRQDPLIQSNIFNAKMTSNTGTEAAQKTKEEELSKICDTATQQTSLPLTLMSTVVLRHSNKSIAAFSQSGNANYIHEGEQFQGARIDHIDRLETIVKNMSTNTCERVYNQAKMDELKYASNLKILSPKEGQRLIESQRPKGIKNEGNTFFIDKNFLKDKLKDLPLLLTQANSQIIKNPDGSISFKIFEVAPGGIFSHLNIQENDIITKINGKNIQNINEVMNLFAKLGDLNNLKLTVKRDGREENLEYKIDGSSTIHR